MEYTTKMTYSKVMHIKAHCDKQRHGEAKI